MARVNYIQTNLTAGELSPRLLGRVDIARYKNAVSTMENAYPLVHGGGNRSPGSQFIAGTKFNAKKSRLIPFVFSVSQAYVLEFGDFYMRVYTGSGQVLLLGVPFEIATPFAEADLPEINYVQSADSMFNVHPNYAVRKLTRSSNTSWKLAQFQFIVEPHEELGILPATTITLSAASVGAGRTVTAGAACFLASDVGRKIISGDGSLTITVFTDTTHVTGDITDAFASVGPIASQSWTLTESPKTTCTPSVASPIGVAITLTLGANGWQNDGVRSDVGRYVHVNGGVVEITGVSSATVATGIIRSILLGIIAANSGYWSEESKVWNAINGFARAVTLFEQRLILAGSAAFPNTVWGSLTGQYNDFTPGAADDDGLSFTIASDQQNPVQQLASLKQLIPLTYGGEFTLRGGIETPLSPTNVQARSESNYGTKNVHPVRIGRELLYIQRSGRKVRSLNYSIYSDNYESPDVSVLSEHITESGITEMAYVQEPDHLVAMVRGDGQMVTLSFDREQEVLGWARRVTDGQFESVASIPFGDKDQLWAVVKRTVNGVTVRYVELMEFNSDITVNRQTDASITGLLSPIVITAMSWAAGLVTVDTFSAHGLAPGGFVRISGAMPAAYNGDYTVVSTPSGTRLTFNKETDPGVATVLGTATPLAKTWSGLTHLEAKMVDVVADGVVFPQTQVAGGQVTLPRAVASVEIGLHYESTIVTLTPEIMLPEGSLQGRPVSLSECVVRLYKSIGCKVENEQIPFRKFGAAVLDTPIAPFTGDKRVPVIGWARGRQLTIKQTQPLPFCLLSIMMKVTVGD